MLGLFLPKRNHHQKSQRDDALTDQHARRLPGSKVGNLGEGVRAHADDVCQPGKDGEDQAGGDQAAADVAADSAFESPPKGVQAEIPPGTHPRETDQEDDDLHEADDGTAVPAEEVRFGADCEDEKSDESDGEAQANARGEGVIHAGGGGNGGGGWERLVGHD